MFIAIPSLLPARATTVLLGALGLDEAVDVGRTLLAGTIPDGSVIEVDVLDGDLVVSHHLPDEASDSAA